MQEPGLEILDALRRINIAMARRMKTYCEPLGLTGPQVLILCELFRQDRQKICDLSRAAGMKISNISAICQRLEDHGYVHRIRSQEDQRVVLVCLSEKSKDLVRQIGCLDKSEIVLQFKKLPKDQLELILSGLHQLEALLNEETL